MGGGLIQREFIPENEFVSGRGAEDFFKILYHPSRELKLTHSYIRVLHFTADWLSNRHPRCQNKFFSRKHRKLGSDDYYY